MPGLKYQWPRTCSRLEERMLYLSIGGALRGICKFDGRQIVFLTSSYWIRSSRFEDRIAGMNMSLRQSEFGRLKRHGSGLGMNGGGGRDE
jgi:hypothetical protein